MAELKHRVVTTNGIRIHLVEAGKGPLVLMVHGFPESWYLWWNQLHALADDCYRAAAIDVRDAVSIGRCLPSAYAPSSAHKCRFLRKSSDSSGVGGLARSDRTIDLRPASNQHIPTGQQSPLGKIVWR